MYLAPLLKGYPWNWVSALGVKKKTNDGATKSRKRFATFSRLDTIHQCNRQTDRQTDSQSDGRTPGDSKDRAYA